MANFQVIFNGNEDELYRFVITWKMMTDTKKYEERTRQIQRLEEKLKEMREELRRLEEKKREIQREIAELTSLREALKRETAGVTRPKVESSL